MMKRFTLILSLLLVITSTVLAQSKIPSTIFIIDPQSNTQVPANSEAANLFKTSLVNLVTSTSTAKLQAALKFSPGKRSIVITQADPQTNGNAYQLVLQRTFIGQISVVYTFQYNVDQNKLYFFDPNAQNWVEEAIEGNNVLNLNNCQAYGAFNQLNTQPAVAAVPNNQQPVTEEPVDNTVPDTSVSVPTVPPALPDYEQPECPEEGYLWQPGYWAYSMQNRDYYWVPGVWVAPPSVGLLWTPPYWGYVGGFYVFHTGYWGNSIGFYGGIDYGYGYGGVGFVGGNWYGGHFRYNTAIVRVNSRFHYVYVDRTVYRERGRERYSFNGHGGYTARPNAHEMAAMREHHVMATHEQIRNQRTAREDKTQFASHSGGRPGNLAAAKAPERRPTEGLRNEGAPGSREGTRPGNTPGAPGGTRQANTPVTQGGAGRPGNTPGAPGGTRQANTPGSPGGAPVGTRPGNPPGAPGGRPSGAPGAPGGKPGLPGGAKSNSAPKQVKAPKSEPPAKKKS